MKLFEAKRLFFECQAMNSKKTTMRNYELLIGRFCSATGDREIDTVSTDEVLSFLTHHTEGTKQTTKRFRYSLLSSFFNFIRNSIDPNFQNLCDSPILK